MCSEMCGKMVEPEIIQCLNCHLGALKRIRATYARWLEDELLIIPDVGAWECDVCGEFVYDDDAIVLAELLAGENPPARVLEQRQLSPGETPSQSQQELDHRRA